MSAEYSFLWFHKIIQKLFEWENQHLHKFEISEKNDILVRLSFDEEDEKDLENTKLSDCFPQHQNMQYTYDFGDNWEHEIKFIQEIQDYDKELLDLVSAEGQAPLEDIRGIDGFVEFYEIMQEPKHL